MSTESSSVPASRDHVSSRRAFLVGAGATALGAEFFADLPLAQARTRLTKGDEAILRFLSAAEILETDLWQQYNELGGIQDSQVPGGTGNKPPTPRRCRCSTRTWPSTSTTTPRTSSRTSRS